MIHFEISHYQKDVVKVDVYDQITMKHKVEDVMVGDCQFNECSLAEGMILPVPSLEGEVR